MSDKREADRLLQWEWRRQVAFSLFGDGWIRVYEKTDWGAQEQVSIDCMLLSNAHIENPAIRPESKILASELWPSIEVTYNREGSIQTVLYDRYGRDDQSLEPLILHRQYHGVRPEEIEVVEEYRLFHNLYSTNNSTYYSIDDSGEDIPVVRVSDTLVEFRRDYLRRFLAAKGMSLVIYFERIYCSSQSLADLGIDAQDHNVLLENGAYNYVATEHDQLSTYGYKSRSSVAGHLIIPGSSIEKCGLWPFNTPENRKYLDFVIGTDTDDEPMMFTCDPERLQNLFGANPDSPMYCTPVFFKREVLAKYYREPSRYRVDDGFVRCGEYWSIRIDNSHQEYVIALLWDLGRQLPTKVQEHWKHYNVMPDGGLSATSYSRWFEMEWMNPGDSALLFKQSVADTEYTWNYNFGWSLFRPLSKEDAHHLQTLCRPLTQERSELDEIMLSLAKVLIDSINVKELKPLIPDYQSRDAQGKPKRSIKVLEEYLRANGFLDTERYIACIRDVQMLRSTSAAHRKGDKFHKVKARLGLDSKSTVQVADDIFTTLTDFLDSLRRHFCEEPVS